MQTIFSIIYWKHIAMQRLFVPYTEWDGIHSMHILYKLVKCIICLDLFPSYCESSKFVFKLNEKQAKMTLSMHEFVKNCHI